MLWRCGDSVSFCSFFFSDSLQRATPPGSLFARNRRVVTIFSVPAGIKSEGGYGRYETRRKSQVVSVASCQNCASPLVNFILALLYSVVVILLVVGVKIVACSRCEVCWQRGLRVLRVCGVFTTKGLQQSLNGVSGILPVRPLFLFASQFLAYICC